jgi:tryptophan synthase alpha chain
MSRISSAFQQGNHKALIGYITAGYPSLQDTVDIASLLADSGCDMIELGIPFSDPLADGVTIQNATHQALLNGVTIEKCLQVAAKIRTRINVPLLFMGYLNPVLHFGAEKFCTACALAGMDGLIIPDLPPGELPSLDTSAGKHGIDMISFLVPNSSDSRIQEVAAKARGFIYIASVTGVTGARDTFSTGLSDLIKRVRASTNLPLCIGFGISNAAQARSAAAMADGVIIGSRIIQLMEDGDSTYKKLSEFIREVRQTIDC